MPFELTNRDPPPGGFILAAAQGHVPTAAEQSCIERINQLIAAVADLVDDGTPRGAEIALARNNFMEQLRARSEEFVAGALTADDFFVISFNYEGRLDERLARVRAALIAISAYRDPDHPEIFVDVQYEIGPGTTTVEQLDLKRAIDKAVTVVKVVFAGRDPIRLHEYIRDLVSIGRIGLVEGNIDLAKNALETFQEEFVVREAPSVKNHYIRRLGIASGVFVLLFGALYLGIRYAAMPSEAIGWKLWLLPDAVASPSNPIALYRFRNFLLLAIGASFSAWLAFLIRQPRLDFNGLVQLDDELLHPVSRVLFTIGLSFVIGLLFWTRLIEITIGGFTTNFANNGMTAILIGVFCGIASRALATAVSRRAEDFAGNVGAVAPRGVQA